MVLFFTPTSVNCYASRISEQLIGVCYIGLSPNKTKYVVLTFAEDVAAKITFLYGPILRFQKAEMTQNGFSFVVGHLRKKAETQSESHVPNANDSL